MKHHEFLMGCALTFTSALAGGEDIDAINLAVNKGGKTKANMAFADRTLPNQQTRDLRASGQRRAKQGKASSPDQNNDDDNEGMHRGDKSGKTSKSKGGKKGGGGVSKSGKSSKSNSTPDQYVEKDNTYTRDQGLVSEVIGRGAKLDRLQTEYGQGVTKAEMIKLCANECDEVLEDCTIFQMGEQTNANGDTRYFCLFYNDDSIAAHFHVDNPVKSGSGNSRYSVFHKGHELVLPEFQGCDVPVGDAVKDAVTCRVGKYVNDTLKYWPSGPLSEEFCIEKLDSLASDFENYIVPSVICTFEQLGFNDTKLEQCLGCLANAEGVTCASKSICDDDNIITGTCGNVCPQSETCMSKTQTALLCSSGAKPEFNSEGQYGSCLNADNPDFPKNYLELQGNGDYKCLD